MAKADTLGGTVATKAFYESDLDEVEGIQLSATTLYSITLTNAATGVTPYIKFFDTTGTVTLGTTAPVLAFGIQPNYANCTITLGTTGLSFANGLQIACTTDAGTAGSTPPTDAITVVLVFS
jgi:hypothetical protein